MFKKLIFEAPDKLNTKNWK